jgi:integrase
MEPYTVEEMCQLLDAAEGTGNAPRWALAAVLGLRQGEVLGLQWDDVELGDEGILCVRRQLQRLGWQHGCGDPSVCHTASGSLAKRGADCPQRLGGGLVLRPVKSAAGRRTLVLPPSLAVDLRHHRRLQAEERLASEVWEQGPGNGWVFANEARRVLDPRADHRAFKELCSAAGLPKRRLHDLRHTAATMMLDNDLDPKTAGQVLGHSQIVLTARYQHVLADRKSVAAGRIEAAVFGKRRRPKQAGHPSTAP